MEIIELDIKGVKILTPALHRDERGFFSETWNSNILSEHGIDLRFVQDNHCKSNAKGTLRGLHFQAPPKAQDKLVRVVSGSIYDVAVDIRENSPTFRQWVGATISAELWNQILIPKGFAHGYVTLEPGTEVVYKVTDGYTPEHDHAIRYDDPGINVKWPDVGRNFILSDKDLSAPLLNNIDTGFYI